VKPIAISSLCEALGMSCPAGGDQTIRGVSIDSRTVKAGDCFFAVRGANFDGHDFLREVQDKGAVCAVADREPPADLKIPAVRVGDTVAALGQLAGWYRGQVPAAVIGITGSAGKTSTRQILYHVLSGRFGCRQAPKSFNNQIGVPLTLLSTEPDDQFLIVEIGSNHPGEIAPLARMARPDIAIITHIAPAHLEGFGSIGAIVEEKASILEGLGPEGKIFINGDIPELAAYIRRKYNRPFIMVGESPYCQVRAESMHSCGTSGWLRIEGQTVPVPLAGTASLRNVLTVWSVCRELGISLSDFAGSLRTVRPAEMRLQIEHIGPVTVLNDCYNANPASMENAIDCLSRMAAQQKRRGVFIAGDMKELGPHSVSLHRQIGRFAAERGVRVILAAGEFAESVMEGARKTDNAGVRIEQLRTFGGVEGLCNNVHLFIRPDDIILVKASRSARFESVVARLRDLFGKQQTTE
jgi:UDP-N-acetylmuramoyl-tripeptide--D-alanyl-D-alanine ligase